MSAMTERIDVEEEQRENGADAGRGKGGENRDGMDVAFVENAEHDVDDDERGKDEERLVLEGGLKGGGRALEGGVDAGRKLQLLVDLVDDGDGVADGLAGGEVEGNGGRGELSLVIDGERGGLFDEVGEG